MKLTIRTLLLFILLSGLLFPQYMPQPSKKDTSSSGITSAVLIARKTDGTYEAYTVLVPGQTSGVFCKDPDGLVVLAKMKDEEFKQMTDRLHVLNNDYTITVKETGKRKAIKIRGGRIKEEKVID